MYSCYKADNVISPGTIVPYEKPMIKKRFLAYAKVEEMTLIPVQPIIQRAENGVLQRVHKFFTGLVKKKSATDMIILDQRLSQYDNTRKLYGRELIARLREFPYWSGVLMKRPHLRREFTFTDYRKAIIFVNLVSEEALLASHYPKIVNSHLNVAITIRTVEVDGISLKDFALAKAIDNVAEKVKGLVQ